MPEMETVDTLNCSRKRIVDADFSHAHLHDPNLEGARLTGAWLRNTDIDGYIGGLKINGVEVAPLVDAELDRLYPERARLRADDPETLAVGWATVEEIWEKTVARARKLPEALLHERVNEEWSFLETLRHLVFATDAWILYSVDRQPRPYHPWGVPHTSYDGGPELGIDEAADPSLDEVLAVRRERMDAVRNLIATMTARDLDRACEPVDDTGYPQRTEKARDCFRIVMDEEWCHNLYANRDLAILESRT